MPKIDVYGEVQKIVVGVPFYGGQRPDWWTAVTAEIVRMPQYAEMGGAKLEYFATVALRGVAVQNQRNGIVDWFLKSSAHWLWFIDDDTIPPRGAIGNLMRTQNTLVSGLYWGGDPKDMGDWKGFPLAYMRRDDGMYIPMHDLRPDILDLVAKRVVLEADGAGAGCLLIHRSVFEDIMATHTMIRLTNSGGARLVPNSALRGKLPDKAIRGGQTFVKNGILHEPVMAASREPGEFYPFFIQEHGRTEDFAFFEAAKRAGHQLLIDTGVEAEHIKSTTISGKDFVVEPGFHVYK